MRKGCRAHIQRKVVVRDDAVMASTPPYFYFYGLKRNVSFDKYLKKAKIDTKIIVIVCLVFAKILPRLFLCLKNFRTFGFPVYSIACRNLWRIFFTSSKFRENW
jgi:hypothetical protein